MISLTMCIDSRSFIEKLFQDYIPNSLFVICGLCIPFVLLVLSFIYIINFFTTNNKNSRKKLIKKTIGFIIMAIILFVIVMFVGWLWGQARNDMSKCM